MGIFDWLKKSKRDSGHTIDDLASRMGVTVDDLQQVEATYETVHIPKRRGGTRALAVPNPMLKFYQRRMLHRVLARLRSHACATGFEKGHSIVSNAAFHAGQDVVIRMDIRDFFTTTDGARLKKYVYGMGWNREASVMFVKLCTFENGLPQGAPTSPRLSNLVNIGMDHALSHMAHTVGARYTRYADDMTFSYSGPAVDYVVATVIRGVVWTTQAFGYQVHMRKKLHVRHRHQRQIVTGLVVNEGVNLPRSTRRWLRAVEHNMKYGRPTTISEDQLRGWQSYRAMVEQMSSGEV